MIDDKEAEMKEHLEAFNIFDHDKDQKLSKEEAKYAYMALGWNFTEDELNKIMQEKAKDDLIDFNGFSNYLFERSKDAEIEEEIMETFVEMDKDGDGKINAKEAISLSEKILKNESWAAAWACEEVIAGQEILLDGDYGKITMLSPLQEDLNALELQFKKEFWSKFFDKHSKQYKADEEIYEVLLRLWETTIIEERASKVTYTKPTKDSFLKAADTKVLPVSLPNRCSIAFVYEYNNHRFLWLGDAGPGIVAASLKGKIEGEMPYLMDMSKVSHHGSSHSTTSELMKIADSMHYYFTGGNKEERPSLETLSRIITEPLNGQERRVLHFNRKNTVLKDLCAMPELEEFPCEMDLENKPYEVEI